MHSLNNKRQYEEEEKGKQHMKKKKHGKKLTMKEYALPQALHKKSS